MNERFWQCCYTNASRETGGTVSSGWQAVCVSPDLPRDAYTFCVKLQNANSMIRGTMTDENGEVLNLLEICGDGSYVCVVRTQYGMLDRLGRPNMFSHAFVFPCRDRQAVMDPNLFVTIANENFKDSEKAAAVPPKALTRLPRFTIDGALELCGLTEDLYVTLIRCVYAHVSDRRSTKPLFVQYDGGEEKLRALLFAIYYGLPFSIRRQLSVASVKTENTVGFSLVFSKDAKEQELFIDPATGENSVLSPRVERRIARLGFLDSAARRITLPDVQRFYSLLEEKTMELGDPVGANELMMKIAFSYIQLLEGGLEAVEDGELDARLSDALRSVSTGSSKMDAYIAHLLEEIIRRGLVLTDENEESLAQRLQAPSSPRLEEAAELYTFTRFNNLPAEEAAEKLLRMPANAFAEYRNKLLASQRGQKILDTYYATALAGEILSWEVLEWFERDSADLPRRPLTQDMLDQKAWELYITALSPFSGGDIAPVCDAYQRYGGFMDRRLDSPESRQQCRLAAREAFWEKFSFEGVDFDMLPGYEALAVESLMCQAVLRYCRLPEVYFQQGAEVFFTQANWFFQENKEELGAAAKGAIQKLMGEVCSRERFPSPNFSLWGTLLVGAGDSLIFEALLDVYRCVTQRDAARLYPFLRRFSHVWKSTGCPDDTAQRMAGLVADCCEEWEGKRTAVPLDVWLLLGSLLYPNPFALFNERKPLVLQQDEMEISRQSALLADIRFRTAGESYVREKGQEARTVKKWLSARQRYRAEEFFPQRYPDVPEECSRSSQGQGADTGEKKRKGILPGWFRKK